MTPRRESNTELNREHPSLMVAQHLHGVAASLPSIEYHLQQDEARTPATRPILRVVQNGERSEQPQPTPILENNGLDQQSILRAVNAAHAEKPAGNDFPSEFMNNGQNHEAPAQDNAA